MKRCKEVLAAIDFSRDSSANSSDLLDALITEVPRLLSRLLAEKKTAERQGKTIRRLVREYCDKVVQLLEEPDCVPEDHLAALLRDLTRNGVLLFRDYPKLRKRIIKSLVGIWSSWPSDSVRVGALLTLHHFCSKYSSSSLLEGCRRLAYQHYSRACRTLGPHNLGQASLMLNGLVELFSLQPASGAQFAIKSLRRMASLLQQATKKPEKEHIKKVLCWPFIALIRFWTRLLVVTSAAAKPSPYKEILFPVTSLLCCLLNFQPSPRYFAFHFHIVSCALELMSQLKVFIPVVPCLLKIIGHVARQPLYKLESKKAAYDLVALYKVPKTETTTKGYLESVGEDALFYLLTFLAQESGAMTFPEHAQPVLNSLRDVTLHNLKMDRTFKKQIEGHMTKISQQSKDIKGLYIKDALTPAALATGEHAVPESSRPLVSYVANLEKVRTSKRKMLSERSEESAEEQAKPAKGAKTKEAPRSHALKAKHGATAKSHGATALPTKKKRALPESKLRSNKKAKRLANASRDEDIVEDFVLED